MARLSWSRRLLGALCCALLLLAPLACDDATGVGGELIDPSEAGPQHVALPLDVEPVQYAPITGSAGIRNTSRFLAGQTTGDPLGDVTATGYVDFRPSPSNVDPSGASIDSVQLRLRPAANAFYGDTTQTTELALYDLEEEWEAAGARADTSLSGIVESQRITTFSVAPGDSLVSASLPSSWIADHADQLRLGGDSTFTEAFHGFQARPVEGGNVAAFRSAATSLRIVFEDEDFSAVAYPLTRQLTTIRQPNPQQPDGRHVLQSGTGRALAFDFDDGLFPDSLRSASVNSASLVLETDSVLAGTPPGYTRPRLDQLNVYDATADDSLRLLPGFDARTPARLSLSSDRARFDVAEFPLQRFVQNALLDTSEIDRLHLRPGPSEGVPLLVRNTPRGAIGVVPTSLVSALVLSGDEDSAAQLELVYTSTDE